MKTLADHTILYDAECPMCNLYTKGFINAGMMVDGSRTPYQQIPQNKCNRVDMQRAVNEIALVDNNTGEITYGVKSLFKIIGYSFPLFKSLFDNQLFIWVISKVYAFVSYNRRVIVPAQHEAGTPQPTFRLGYRLAYLLCTWLAVGYILTRYAPLLRGIVPAGSAYREYIICGGQILVQGVVVLLVAPGKKWDYLGNMMTISLAGALLLLPMQLVAHCIAVPPLVCTLYFLGVAGLMLLEHMRRTKLLGLAVIMSATWVAYRVAVLVCIFYTH